jgi:hypothetical protein
LLVGWVGTFGLWEGWAVMDGVDDVGSYMHVAKKGFIDWSCVCLFFLLARANECGTHNMKETIPFV